jgi:hypothetical protein
MTAPARLQAVAVSSLPTGLLLVSLDLHPGLGYLDDPAARLLQSGGGNALDPTPRAEAVA